VAISFQAPPLPPLTRPQPHHPTTPPPHHHRPPPNRHVPGNLYRSKQGSNLDAATNELVIRIQPQEAIYLKVNNKVGVRGEG
jgi:hypothetical protein